LLGVGARRSRDFREGAFLALVGLPYPLLVVKTDPSPVPLRLVKAPERDTLSPRERATVPTFALKSGGRHLISSPWDSKPDT
jgi:hypothetical protein